MTDVNEEATSQAASPLGSDAHSAFLDVRDAESVAQLVAKLPMSKVASIGLSKGQRIEADHYGVQVSVLCPTAVDTPMLDSGVPTDLSEPWRPDIRGYLSKLVPPIPLDEFATYAIDAVASNRETVVAPFQARSFVLLNRFFPGLVSRSTLKVYREELQNRAADEAKDSGADSVEQG